MRIFDRQYRCHRLPIDLEETDPQQTSTTSQGTIARNEVPHALIGKESGTRSLLPTGSLDSKYFSERIHKSGWCIETLHPDADLPHPLQPLSFSLKVIAALR